MYQVQQIAEKMVSLMFSIELCGIKQIHLNHYLETAFLVLHVLSHWVAIQAIKFNFTASECVFCVTLTSDLALATSANDPNTA